MLGQTGFFLKYFSKSMFTMKLQKEDIICGISKLTGPSGMKTLLKGNQPSCAFPPLPCNFLFAHVFIFCPFKKFYFSIMVYIQYDFVLLSGAQHSG